MRSKVVIIEAVVEVLHGCLPVSRCGVGGWREVCILSALLGGIVFVRRLICLMVHGDCANTCCGGQPPARLPAGCRVRMVPISLPTITCRGHISPSLHARCRARTAPTCTPNGCDNAGCGGHLPTRFPCATTPRMGPICTHNAYCNATCRGNSPTRFSARCCATTGPIPTANTYRYAACRPHTPT